MKTIVKHPGHPAHFAHVPNTLEGLQSVVDGYIETVTISPDLVMICNEEGFLRHLPDNCQVCGMRIVGTFILAGVNGDKFDDVPLSQEDAELLFPEMFQEGKS